MTKCWACGEENQAGEQFCEACGLELDAEGAEAQPLEEPTVEDPQLEEPPVEDPLLEEPPVEDPLLEEPPVEDPLLEEPPVEDPLLEEPPVEDPRLEEPPVEEPKARRRRDRPRLFRKKAEGAEGHQVAPTETEEAPEAPPPKAGYLVFPDKTEKEIPPSQWLIGRADLAKFVPETERANEISRGHLTVFQEGEKFFIEDGKTMVQDKPSTNRTWLIRGSSRHLVTGKGRSELQDADEIDIAELVKLQFVAK